MDLMVLWDLSTRKSNVIRRNHISQAGTYLRSLFKFVGYPERLCYVPS